MKKLMLGNEAVARGLYEAGCSVVSSYPGTPSTEITETVATYDEKEIYSEWAPNEKVALEVAFGASLGGKRSACAMKHVGLNVAADPLYTMSYTGVNAGLVICVADDPGMHSSQNEQDSRHAAVAAKVPMLEPADAGECLAFAKYAFELSEKFDTPVLLRLCTRISHSQSIVEIGERTVCSKEYKKTPEKYIMMPAYAKKRHPIVEARTAALRELAEASSLNRIEGAKSDIGIITSGTSYLYVKSLLGDSVGVLKLGIINPLPVKLIEKFASEYKKLYVVEELDAIIESFCRSLGISVIGKEILPLIGEFSQSLIAKAFEGIAPAAAEYLKKAAPSYSAGALPNRPPVMCAGCPHRGIYYALAKNKITVIGDIGCYTLGAQPPLCAVDTTLCMGASVSGLHGFNIAAGKEAKTKAVAVIGDSTFIHSGVTGLINIAYNGTNSTVIILDNSITGMTGHQQNPTTGMNIRGEPAGKVNLEALCAAIGIRRVRVCDPYNIAECEKAVLEELEADEPSVIISRRPCVLLKTTVIGKPFKVNADLCRGCRKCMSLGCPAISMKDKKAVIDFTLCTGCGLCASLCPFSAIEEGLK